MAIVLVSRGRHFLAPWSWQLIVGETVIDDGTAWTERQAGIRGTRSFDRFKKELEL